MAAPFALKELRFVSEASFCENSTSLVDGTPFDDANVLLCRAVSFQPEGERIRDTSYLARMNDEELSHIGPRSATLEFTTYWCGHGSAPTGALVESWLQDFLSEGLGGGSVAQVGATVSGTTSATQFAFAGGTAVAGAILRVGVKGDTRGDGQAVVVDNASTVTTLTAMPAAANVGDQVYPTQVAHHSEGATLGTKRFLFAHTTTGAQILVHGCQLAGARFTIPMNGGLPEITWTYRAAYWRRSAATTPSTVAAAAAFVAPVAGGSVFINSVGTTTRATVQPAMMELTLDLGLEPIVGPGGVFAEQYIVGWARTRCKPTLRMRVPWAATYETEWDVANQSYVYKHILATLNAVPGRSVGFYLPRASLVGPRPSPITEANGQQYVEITYLGRESTTTTTELTRSAIRFFSG